MQGKNGLEERTKRTEKNNGIKQEKLETAKKNVRRRNKYRNYY